MIIEKNLLPIDFETVVCKEHEEIDDILGEPDDYNPQLHILEYTKMYMPDTDQVELTIIVNSTTLTTMLYDCYSEKDGTITIDKYVFNVVIDEDVPIGEFVVEISLEKDEGDDLS